MGPLWVELVRLRWGRTAGGWVPITQYCWCLCKTQREASMWKQRLPGEDGAETGVDGAETGVMRLQVKGGPGMDHHPSLEARKERGRVVLRVIRRNQRCQHLDLNCQLPEGQRCIPVVLTRPTPRNCVWLQPLETKAQAYTLRKLYLPLLIIPHMLNRLSKEDPESGHLQSSVHRFKFRNIKLKNQIILCLVLNHVIWDNVSTTNGIYSSQTEWYSTHCFIWDST